MKLTRDELEQVGGEELEEFLRQKRYRLSTSPFGARPGKVVAFIARAAPWKKRGKVPRDLHLVQP